MQVRPGYSRFATVKGALKNFLLLLVVLAGCLVVVEVLSRLIVDDGKLYELEMWKYARDVKVRDPRPDIGHRHGPDREAQLMGTGVRTNAQGFRGPAIADKAAPGVVRIAFVGDSTTLGWGVAEQETFAAQVVADLARQGRKVEGFNLGVGNYNTTQELALFRDVGARMRPDIIVLSYFINDAEPMPTYGPDRWLERHSAAWIVLSYRLDSLLRQFGGRPDWKQYYRGLYDADAEGWRKSREAIARFAELAREIGATLVVFNIPELRELRPYPFADVTDKVRRAVEDTGVPFVDLLPSVQDLAPSDLWVTVPDPHPNGTANTAFARTMTRELLPMLDRLCHKQGKGC